MGYHPLDKPDGDPEALIAALRREIDWTLLVGTLKQSPQERLIRLIHMQMDFDTFQRAREKRDAESAAAKSPSGVG